MKFLLVAFSPLFIYSAAYGATLEGTYNVDPAHSKIGFEVPHLVISSVEGKFTGVEGKIDFAKDFKKSKFEGKVATATVDTGEKKRDEHLRSPDFFDSAKYPDILFKTTSIEGNPDSFKLTGDLTIHGVKKSVVLDAKVTGPIADGFGNEKVAVKATTVVKRKDFGLNWNKAIEVGPVVGDDVTIDLKLEAGRPLKK